jgi:hypothetical protein
VRISWIRFAVFPMHTVKQSLEVENMECSKALGDLPNQYGVIGCDASFNTTLLQW